MNRKLKKQVKKIILSEFATGKEIKRHLGALSVLARHQKNILVSTNMLRNYSHAHDCKTFKTLPKMAKFYKKLKNGVIYNANIWNGLIYRGK